MFHLLHLLHYREEIDKELGTGFLVQVRTFSRAEYCAILQCLVELHADKGDTTHIAGCSCRIFALIHVGYVT